MRPDRTAKSMGFSVWRISPKVQRIHRKKRKTPKKSARGTNRARVRGRTAGRSAPPQRRPPVRATNASGSASRAIGTKKNDDSSQPGVAARTRPTGIAKESTASARESGSASSPRKRRASTAAPDAPARRRTKAKRSAVGTVTERFQGSTTPSPRPAYTRRDGGRFAPRGRDRRRPRRPRRGGSPARGGRRCHGLREIPRGRRPRGRRRRGRNTSRALLSPPLHQRRRLRVVRRGVRPRKGPRLAQVAHGILLGRPALRLRDPRLPPLLLTARNRGPHPVRPLDAEAAAELRLEEPRGRNGRGLDAAPRLRARAGCRLGPAPRPEVRATRGRGRPRLALGKDRPAHPVARQDRPRRTPRIPDGLVRARRRRRASAREGARRRRADLQAGEDRQEIRQRLRRGVRRRKGDVRPRPVDGRDSGAPEARDGPSRGREAGVERDRVLPRALPDPRARPVALALLLAERGRPGDALRRRHRAHELHPEGDVRRPARRLHLELRPARLSEMAASRRRALGRVPARPEEDQPDLRRELDPEEADRARRICTTHRRAELLKAPPAAPDARARAVVDVHGADLPGGPRPELRGPHRARGGGRDPRVAPSGSGPSLDSAVMRNVDFYYHRNG